MGRPRSRLGLGRRRPVRGGPDGEALGAAVQEDVRPEGRGTEAHRSVEPRLGRAARAGDPRGDQERSLGPVRAGLRLHWVQPVPRRPGQRRVARRPDPQGDPRADRGPGLPRGASQIPPPPQGGRQVHGVPPRSRRPPGDRGSDPAELEAQRPQGGPGWSQDQPGLPARYVLIRRRRYAENEVSATPDHDAAPELPGAIDRLDRRIVAFLERWGITVLRVSLGLVFVWFGALKIFQISPVADLVARTVYWVDPSWFVPVLGGVEVIIGIGLLAGRALRTILALFWLQMLGTFLVLIVLPEVAFQRGNPLLLTVEGEFVVKNLVLLSAGMVVGSTVRRRKRPRLGPV